MANGKRTFATAFKDWIADRALQPGVSVAGLALEHGVNANQLRRWMMLHQRRSTSQEPAVLPVSIADVPTPKIPTPRLRTLLPPTIEIELAGAVVRVPAGIDPQHLRVVLQALRS
jgi:transposase